MATIEPYTLKSGATRYRVRYIKPDDRKPTDKRGFKSKKEASKWMAKNSVAIQDGKWRPESAGNVSLNSVARAWLDSKLRLAENTKSAYESSLKHIADVNNFGAMKIKAIRPVHVEAWVKALGQQVKPKTLKNSYNVLHAVMKRAVRDNLIPSSPCVDIELPRVEKEEQIFLDAQQVRALADAAGEYSDIIWVLALAGLRWGELAGLQPRDVDLKKQRLHIQRQMTDNGGRIIEKLPKHDKKRFVPLAAKLEPILQERMAGKKRDELLFTTSRGTVLRGGNAQRDWFGEAVKAIGEPDLRPHGLRHTFASLAISAGANIKALQAALGHHSVSFTLDQYGHLYPDDSTSFINAMNTRFA
ncbi:tyrosine-type recombinase/integrase [Corynebacterium sp. H127]|uniref:tyrosine-type recombinase/integrase n=1 Tax=Corynebacterium sp. H127 TaxID=3133418 RepID=UPI0030A9443F